MTGESNTGGYDPSEPAPPTRGPPQRSTAPQSEFTPGQVGVSLLVLALGVATIVGLTLGLT